MSKLLEAVETEPWHTMAMCEARGCTPGPIARAKALLLMLAACCFMGCAPSHMHTTNEAPCVGKQSAEDTLTQIFFGCGCGDD